VDEDPAVYFIGTGKVKVIKERHKSVLVLEELRVKKNK
jgi:hypothetical protein